EAGRGFYGEKLPPLVLQLGEGYAGQVIKERQPLHIQDLRKADFDPLQGPFLESENFATYYAMPLIAKGRILGVLEVYHRTVQEPDEEWLEYLQALARQTAIAIDSAELFQSMESANLDLLQAYDATLEGWAHALDLKDEETEEHSKRVTEMTLTIARKMNFKVEDLPHVRRGALLHDIGKMGIPDAILLKPGPLTDEEWVIMRKHPVYAFEMLAPIDYLRPALEIPYCHHEKFDGTGYPRGLKGKVIPLAACIFAVADVYDALTSDRPYREAWSIEKTLQLIKEASGKHFDPEVVEVFLKEIEDSS
ncbi:MAG: HD domain-containing protein, partial [Dethiobacteria bacterium]|nr:HD domain-containing protein [Dethiobacteria bacterium]